VRQPVLFVQEVRQLVVSAHWKLPGQDFADVGTQVPRPSQSARVNTPSRQEELPQLVVTDG
jgi:hypothetical protein